MTCMTAQPGVESLSRPEAWVWVICSRTECYVHGMISPLLPAPPVLVQISITNDSKAESAGDRVHSFRIPTAHCRTVYLIYLRRTECAYLFC
jgi:hypothetical protein